MPNDSSTGGFIVPGNAPAPLEGTALLDAIQETLVGVTGIDTTLVRPRFQSEPPDIPQTGTCWLSFGIMRRPSDTFPVIQHNGAANGGQGEDDFQRQEELIVLCSFYDDGSTGNAYNMATVLRDGISVPQNMEALRLDQFSLRSVGEQTILPSLMKELWLFRVDLEIHFNRQVDRTYPILNLTSAKVVATANDPGIGTIVDTINIHN